MKTILKLAFLLVAIVLLMAVYVWGYKELEERKSEEITSFEECAAAGHPVMESYPAQCSTPDGKHFVQDVDENVQ